MTHPLVGTRTAFESHMGILKKKKKKMITSFGQPTSLIARGRASFIYVRLNVSDLPIEKLTKRRNANIQCTVTADSPPTGSTVVPSADPSSREGTPEGLELPVRLPNT